MFSYIDFLKAKEHRCIHKYRYNISILRHRCFQYLKDMLTKTMSFKNYVTVYYNFLAQLFFRFKDLTGYAGKTLQIKNLKKRIDNLILLYPWRTHRSFIIWMLSDYTEQCMNKKILGHHSKECKESVMIRLYHFFPCLSEEFL